MVIFWVNFFHHHGFTYHIVNIKFEPLPPKFQFDLVFTYHIVNIKSQNKLSIFNIYTYTTLSNLQWTMSSAIDKIYHIPSMPHISTVKPYFIKNIAHCKISTFLLYQKKYYFWISVLICDIIKARRTTIYFALEWSSS